jgi:hypothetical protein
MRANRRQSVFGVRGRGMGVFVGRVPPMDLVMGYLAVNLRCCFEETQ